MDAGLLGELERVPGAVDVLLIATGQAANGAAAHDGGDFADGVEVVGRGDREAGFHDVDAEIDQRLREFQLLSLVHAAAGRLLAVAERGVENLDLAYFAHRRVPVFGGASSREADVPPLSQRREILSLIDLRLPGTLLQTRRYPTRRADASTLAFGIFCIYQRKNPRGHFG